MSTRFLVKTALASAAACLLSGCASQPSTFGLDDGSATMVRRTCSEIMGLRTGLEFEACGSSLAATYRILQDAHLTLRGDEHCAGQGLARGTAEHAKCVVMFRRTEQPGALLDGAPASVPEARPWQSYFSMSPAQQDERAELSCAQLGLHPATSGFWHCVSNLKYAVANIRYDSMP
jgi:hypothetical protein